MSELSPKTISSVMSELGRIGGRARGASKVRGDSSFYSRISANRKTHGKKRKPRDPSEIELGPDGKFHKVEVTGDGASKE